MPVVTIGGASVHTFGELPRLGTRAPDLALTKTTALVRDMHDVRLSAFPGAKILNILPSMETSASARSVHTWGARLAGRRDVSVLHVSMDLPFAQRRFLAAEGLITAVALSGFRCDFGKRYGVEITDTWMYGLYARAVIVLDEHMRVLHRELTPDLEDEPSYDAALQVADGVYASAWS